MLCSLKELYNGCAKKVGYNCRKLNLDGRTTSLVPLSKELEIVPGSRCGQTITYAGKGHEECGPIRSDLIFTIREAKEDHYERLGDDLVFTDAISLAEAIASSNRVITTLGGKRLLLPMDEIISPDTVKAIPGEGMPLPGTSLRGTLYVRFAIRFPEVLAEDKKTRIREILA